MGTDHYYSQEKTKPSGPDFGPSPPGRGLGLVVLLIRIGRDPPGRGHEEDP